MLPQRVRFLDLVVDQFSAFWGNSTLISLVAFQVCTFPWNKQCCFFPISTLTFVVMAWCFVLFCFCFILDILPGARWNYRLDLICIFLIAKAMDIKKYFYLYVFHLLRMICLVSCLIFNWVVYLLVYVYIYMRGSSLCTLVHLWRSKTTLWSQFTHSSFRWAPGMELRSLNLHSNGCYLLSHLAGPVHFLIN